MTYEVVAVAPVLGRPQNVEPLAWSWKRGAAPGRLLFVAEPSDEAEVAEIRRALDDRVHLLLAPEGCRSWASKVNLAYRRTDEPWLLLAADDVRFWAGWWDQTSGLRADPAAGVIGTNDLGNPRVMRGEHATHPLVRRVYADSQGTIDRPGEVCCEEYRHWFVDDELVRTARARGAFRPCLGAGVEHLHPIWGRGQVDDTYILGQSFVEQDKATWERRLERIQALEESL